MRNLIVFIIISNLLLACSSDADKNIDQLLQEGNKEQLLSKKESLLKAKDSINGQLQKISSKLESLQPERNLTLVDFKEAKTDTFTTYFNVQASVTTDENIILNPEFSGVIEKIYVEEGDKVKKGDLIARIDAGGLQERLDDLKNQLSLAKTTYERRKRLWDQNIGSEIEYLQAETSYNSLKQNISQVKKELDKTQLTAPFDGEIDDVLAEVGEMAMPGTKPIARITSLNDLYIEADIPERYLGDIQKGTPVIVNSKAGALSFGSSISRVAQTIQASNRSFRVRVNIPKEIDQQLKPNMVLKLTINNYQNTEAFVISESILQENTKSEPYIFKLKKGKKDYYKTDYTLVELGKSYNGFIEVKKGIQAGDKIVTEGAKGLRKDQKVKVKR